MWFWGRGPGWGWRRGWAAWGYGPYGYVDPQYATEMEKQWLKQYEAYLEAELRLVRERLAQLEGREPPAPPAEPGV